MNDFFTLFTLHPLGLCYGYVRAESHPETLDMITGRLFNSNYNGLLGPGGGMRPTDCLSSLLIC